MNISKGSSVSPLFAADTMLAGLARWLRFLGYDTIVRDEKKREEWLKKAAVQKWIVLTRTRRRGGGFEDGKVVLIESVHTGRQVAEVVRKTGINTRDYRFRLCSLCNTSVRPATREEIAGGVEPEVISRYNVYWTCPRCGRIYWRGGHWNRIREWLDKWADEERIECVDPEGMKN